MQNVFGQHETVGNEDNTIYTVPRRAILAQLPNTRQGLGSERESQPGCTCPREPGRSPASPASHRAEHNHAQPLPARRNTFILKT